MLRKPTTRAALTQTLAEFFCDQRELEKVFEGEMIVEVQGIDAGAIRLRMIHKNDLMKYNEAKEKDLQYINPGRGPRYFVIKVSEER